MSRPDKERVLVSVSVAGMNLPRTKLRRFSFATTFRATGAPAVPGAFLGRLAWFLLNPEAVDDA